MPALQWTKHGWLGISAPFAGFNLRAENLLLLSWFFHREYGCIACEHLTIDLSSRIRVQNFLQTGAESGCPIFLLLFASDQDISDINTNQKVFYRNTTLLQIDCSQSLYLNPPPGIFLADGSKPPVIFECDEFYGQIRFVTRKETLI